MPLLNDFKIQSSPLSWKRMWDIIIKGTVGGLKDAEEHTTSSATSKDVSAMFLDPRSKKVRIERSWHPQGLWLS